MRTILVFFFVLALLRCSDKNNKSSVKESATKIIKGKPDSLQVLQIGELRFRRSYAAIQMNVIPEKEIGKMVEKERRAIHGIIL